MFTHAFVIAEGDQNREPFVLLTNRQCPIGLVGVFVFFAISGFLVTQSALHTRSTTRFLIKRAARIFPGLIVSLLFAAFVMGPSISTLPWHAYLADPLLPQFLGRNLLLESGDHRLPGVLILDNSAGTTINGSLWTLRYEIMMYLMLAIMARLGIIRPLITLLMTVAGLLALHFETLLTPFGDLGEWAWFLGFFASGMALNLLRDRVRLGWWTAVAGVVGLVVSTHFRLFIGLFPIFGTLLALSVAVRYWPVLGFLRRAGDLSYGTYIYGWPIEAWVAHTIGAGVEWWRVFAIAVPLTLIVAFFSWHGVEKHAIRLASGSRPYAIVPPNPELQEVS